MGSCKGVVPLNTGGLVDTQNVTEEYEAFLAQTARRIKELRRQRGLTLRDMVVVHGYHDSNWRRMEREGVGSVQSLLRIAKAFGVPLTSLTAGVEDHFERP
jgi:transcriptional regulator with XRE-family HTH domain